MTAPDHGPFGDNERGFDFDPDFVASSFSMLLHCEYGQPSDQQFFSGESEKKKMILNDYYCLIKPI